MDPAVVLRTYIEARAGEIQLDMVEGTDKPLPVLIQDYRLKIPIQDLVDSVILFQQQLDKQKPAKQPCVGTYGQAGLNAPPPPPAVDSSDNSWEPKDYDIDGLWETLPETHENTWDTDILALQPGCRDYGERTKYHAQTARWRLKGGLINYEPCKVQPYVPVDSEPSDATKEILYRHAGLMRTPPCIRGNPQAAIASFVYEELTRPTQPVGKAAIGSFHAELVSPTLPQPAASSHEGHSEINGQAEGHHSEIDSAHQMQATVVAIRIDAS